MDQKRPYIYGRMEPCYDVNPPLWNLFCALTGRPIGQPNYNWLEHDVLTYFLSRGLGPKNNDAGKNAEDHGSVRAEDEGHRFDIRRELSSGSALAVRRVSDTEDAVLFVIGA